MKPIFNGLIPGNLLKTTAIRVMTGLVFLSFVLLAAADTTNFTGEFQAAFWTAQPQAGSIGFSNSATELIIAGPNKPASETTSIEPITYNGPTSSGLVTDGKVQFDYDYDSPFGLDDSAYFVYTPPGGSPLQVLLGQGAGGIITNSFSIDLTQGTTFGFVLFTDTPANKTGGSLTITDFQFHSVPEPSTGALLAFGLIYIAALRRRLSRG